MMTQKEVVKLYYKLSKLLSRQDKQILRPIVKQCIAHEADCADVWEAEEIMKNKYGLAIKIFNHIY